MIVVTAAPPIRCKMIVVMMGMRLICLRLQRQKGCLQEVCTEELKIGNVIVLLHHKFFYKRRMGMAMQNYFILNPFCASYSLFVSVMSL
jgi:hypothetical protein